MSAKKLSQNDYYGYTLMQEMRKAFTDVNDSTFYAILRRLNKEGKTETYLGEESLAVFESKSGTAAF